MLIYMVIWWTQDENMIKGIYDNFNNADKLAKRIYKDMKEYFKTDWNYDTEEEGNYMVFRQAFWWWQELAYSVNVNEIEFEMNQECNIEI